MNAPLGEGPRAASRALFLTGVFLVTPVLLITGARPDYYVGYRCDLLDLVGVLAWLWMTPVLAACLGGFLLPSPWGRRVDLAVLLLGLAAAARALLGWARVADGALAWALGLALGAWVLRIVQDLPRTRRGALALAAVGAAASLWAFSASPLVPQLMRPNPAPLEVRPTREGPVVMALFDALPLTALLGPDGQVDAGLFPNFARLAAGATHYPNAVTNHVLTVHSVPALLTGRYVRENRYALAGNFPQNLFTLLGATKPVRAAEVATRFLGGLPDTRSFGDGRVARHARMLGDLAHVVPTLLRGPLPGQDIGAMIQDLAIFRRNSSFGEVGAAEDRATDFRALVDSLGPGDSNALVWGHLLLPHLPAVHLPDGRQYATPGAANGIRAYLLEDGRSVVFHWVEDPFVVAQNYQRFLLQCQMVDGLLGQLLDKLEALGLYDDALVMVFSDHGTAIAPGRHPRNPLLPSEAAPGGPRPNPEEILSVPLFVKYPGQAEGRVDPRAASLVDLVPTVADVVGVELPWETDGRSLRAPPEDQPVMTFFTDQFQPVSVPLPLSGRERLVREKRAAFAEGPDWLYRLGPLGKLVGRPVASLPAAPAPPLVGGVDPRGGPRGVLAGWLATRAGDPPGLPHLALAHQGTIVAVTRAYPVEAGPSPLLAFAPPELAPPEGAAVDLWLFVPPQAGGPALAPVPTGPRPRP